MKNKRIFIGIAFFLLAGNFCFAQSSQETVIRTLETAEREAILKGDAETLMKLFSPKIMVHNPENTIVKFEQVIERVKTGRINYSSFDRIIENISFIENIAVVMGKEIIIPQGATTNAGKTVTRRFTNVWMKAKGVWRLTARQATIISIQ